MSNKTHEIGVYVEDIPMKLSDKYRPIDFSAYIDEQIQIPDLFDQHYKFSAELYALEVSEMRDKYRQKEKEKQIADSISKLDLKSGNNCKEKENSFKPESSHRDKDREVPKTERRSMSSIGLNLGEILKPLPTMKTTTKTSDNYYNKSDNSIDPNLNIKRKIVRDFESDTSSPFDFVELQTIDDMQELNDVFQAFQTKSLQTKHSIKENNDKNEANIDNNCVIEMSCEQNLSALHNLNGISQLGAYEPVVAQHSAPPINLGMGSSNWVPNSYDHKSGVNDKTSDNMSYNSITANHLTDSEHNLLRSSKSASDLPTLFNSEDSSTVPIGRRQRSHTPPCAPSKTKPKKYINEKQTLVLNDPFEELSQYSKDFVNSISSMGFDRSRVARAVKHIDSDHKKVIDFLLQVQTLEESGFDSCESEIALHMNNYQISDSKKFMESLRQLSEVGFDKKDIIKELVKCNNDRDKALDILLNSQ